MMSLRYHFHTEVSTVIRAECVAEHLQGEKLINSYVEYISKLVLSTTTTTYQ